MRGESRFSGVRTVPKPSIRSERTASVDHGQKSGVSPAGERHPEVLREGGVQAEAEHQADDHVTHDRAAPQQPRDGEEHSGGRQRVAERVEQERVGQQRDHDQARCRPVRRRVLFRRALGQRRYRAARTCARGTARTARSARSPRAAGRSAGRWCRSRRGPEIAVTASRIATDAASRNAPASRGPVQDCLTRSVRCRRGHPSPGCPRTSGRRSKSSPVLKKSVHAFFFSAPSTPASRGASPSRRSRRHDRRA